MGAFALRSVRSHHWVKSKAPCRAHTRARKREEEREAAAAGAARGTPRYCYFNNTRVGVWEELLVSSKVRAYMLL